MIHWRNWNENTIVNSSSIDYRKQPKFSMGSNKWGQVSLSSSSGSLLFESSILPLQFKSPEKWPSYNNTLILYNLNGFIHNFAHGCNAGEGLTRATLGGPSEEGATWSLLAHILTLLHNQQFLSRLCTFLFVYLRGDYSVVLSHSCGASHVGKAFLNAMCICTLTQLSRNA